MENTNKRTSLKPFDVYTKEIYERAKKEKIKLIPLPKKKEKNSDKKD